MTQEKELRLINDILLVTAALVVDGDAAMKKRAEGLARRILREKRIAVEAEREACARVAEETTRAPMDYIDWSPGLAADDRSHKIAAKIRARTDD